MSISLFRPFIKRLACLSYTSKKSNLIGPQWHYCTQMKDKHENQSGNNAIAKDNSEKVKITIKSKSGEVFEILADVNQSLMEVVLDNDIAMHGSCGGKCCCSTCLVYVPEAYNKFMPEMNYEELDILDTVEHIEPNQRLSCQIPVTKELNGAIFRLAL